MKKLICLLIFLASYYLASGSLLKVHPQTDKADLTIGQYIVGWKVPIEITSSVFAGLKIVIEFTTEETPRNEAILSLGSGMDSGKSMEFGITLVENGNHIDLVRKVKVRDAVRDHTTPSWNRTILKRSTNYILTLEIDETRLRYSLQDVGNPSDIQYEYQYDGLSPTYVRSQMEKNGVYVSVDRYHYLVQSLEVTELGYGVGVKPIIPDTHVRHGKIKNVNSGYYLSRLGSTYTSDYLLQKSASQTVNELWKLTTERQSDRTINAYNAVLTSCYRGTNVGPRNCTTSDGAYVYEMVSSDCNIWSVESNSQIRPELFLKNLHSNGYLTTQYSSKEADAYIYQQLKIQDGSKWSFEDLSYQTHIPDGYYTIVNLRSDMYLVIYGKGSASLSYVVQSHEDYSDANVWYFSRQPEGTYRIRNVDTNGYLADYGGYFDPGSYMVMSYGLTGAAEKWVLKNLEDITYLMENYCSGLNMGVRYDSKEPYEYIVQNNNADISYQWNIRPEDFYAGEHLHGFYKIQDAHSSKFLGVEGDSTGKDAYLVLKDKAEDPSGWWSIERDNNGPYILKNVKSQLCAVIQGRSSADQAYLVQEAVPERLRGHCLWRLVKEGDGYYIKSVYDGRYMTVKGHATTTGSYIIQKIPKNGPTHPDPEMLWRFIPVPYGVHN